MELLLPGASDAKSSKEKSPEALTEGQPSNLALSQEMKELYQRQRAVVWGLSQMVFCFSHFVLKQVLKEEDVMNIVGQWMSLNCLEATGPSENL